MKRFCSLILLLKAIKLFKGLEPGISSQSLTYL